MKNHNTMEIKSEITNSDKQILQVAVDGINGWNFNPVALVTNGEDEYYFICKVKTVIEDLQMKMARLYVKMMNTKPRLLSIESIA